ncbi:MAG: glycoside hydrolase family 172 protein [Kiritimatiellia bacterium]
MTESLEALQKLSAEPHLGVSGMISSYDRLGGNVDWGDLKSLWIGEDRYLLADLKGPGCVRRIWMTNVAAEEWLFYFDDEKEPRIRCGERVLFSLDGVGRFPFLPPLTDALSGGAYNYVPLPYAKSLRIVVRIPKAKPDARPYFHVNFETYPAGTAVQTYPKTLSESDTKAVEAARNAWSNIGKTVADEAAQLTLKPETVPANGVLTMTPPFQAGTIKTLAIRLDESPYSNAVERARLLRQLVLRCYWDGSDTPSVEVPLGDFFCNGLHQRRFASLPMANVEGTFVCRFPMPFRKGARIEIRNDGHREVGIQWAAKIVEGDPGKAHYFHAAWNQAINAGTPLRVMRTTGKGTFMGCYLIALGMEGGWNILEGDEKFFRDGDLRPVHHGTGLEDYFNGGWYYGGLFERPLHGLLEKAAMRTCQYRFQIPDPVTFEKSLQMQFEFGDANRAKGYLSAASYWYQDNVGPAGSAVPPLDQRFPAMEQVGAAASMSEVFELERAGLAREAEERSAYFEAIFSNEPFGQFYALRTLAYREMREGSDAVREAYRQVAEKAAPEVAEQARLLLWRSEKPNRALFGGTAYSTFRLFVDERKIGEGGQPILYQAFPVELEPGPHVLRAEVVTKGDQSFYTLGFSSSFTNVVSDVSWDYALTKPEGWPASDGDPSLWKPYAATPWFFPTMQWWQFMPNGYPCVQSGQQVGGPVSGWERPAGRTIYLRRRIQVPSEFGAWSSPFKRRFEIRTPAVRPANDTSNEGLHHN